MRRLALLLALSPLLAACASTTEGILPHPFTAAQIRDTNRPGTVLVFRVTQPDQPAVLQVFEFGATDGEFVDLATRATDTGGNPLGPSKASRPSWSELRDHATYSPDDTVRGSASISTPAGDFSCTFYRRENIDGSVERF